jgi:hypothetical protein
VILLMYDLSSGHRVRSVTTVPLAGTLVHMQGVPGLAPSQLAAVEGVNTDSASHESLQPPPTVLLMAHWLGLKLNAESDSGKPQHACGETETK